MKSHKQYKILIKMAQLNNVETTVSIAGQNCHFIKLSLSQGFNRHHRFEIEINYEELDSKWMENPTKIIKLIGESASITMKHRQTGEQNLFSGIITNVSMVGRHGEQNNYVISGYSPTIQLDGKETMDSFMDKPLKLVAEEAIANSGNGASVQVNPVYGSSIDYICQYNESAFDFLNRLSYLYGEWFFYNGSTIYFGKPSSAEEAEVIYDVDMTHFNLSANLLPSKFNRYSYMNHMDKEMNSNAPDSVKGVKGYLQVALDKSKSIYSSDANIPLEASILSKKDLDDLVEAEKSRSVGNMLVFSGCSHTCKVKIGGIVNIKLPKTMRTTVKDVEKFLVTEVEHIVDQKGYYTNEFKGIPSDMENIPMKPIPMPVANPQIATVMDNADDKGRIKVQFQWQKQNSKSTNWIRVQTPDAGKSDDVPQNRGQVFIPEIDDIVMVGFEYGDPNRPFSMGSIFSELISKGGGNQNYIKTIITRSGHTIKFDDTKGKEKIQIYDIKGNIVEIDTAQESINISANNTINLQATNINMMAGKAFNVTAGISISGQSGTSTSFVSGGSSLISSAKDTQFKAGKTLSASGGKDANLMSGAGAFVKLNAKGNANVQAKKKVKVLSNNNVEINGKKKAVMASSKAFVEGSNTVAIKGTKIKAN